MVKFRSPLVSNAVSYAFAALTVVFALQSIAQAESKYFYDGHALISLKQNSEYNISARKRARLLAVKQSGDLPARELTELDYLVRDSRALGSSLQSSNLEKGRVKRYRASLNPCAKFKRIQRLLKNLGQEWDCSPDWQVNVSLAPNDPSYTSGYLWGLHQISGNDIDAPEAWNVSTGSRDVVVAVIDTGIDYTHNDLAANIWSNPNEIPSNGIDDDHNGYIDDIHGINAITGSGDPMDDHSHGTHCAGTIGAVGDDGNGVVGVNWAVSIVGSKFLASSGSGSLSDAIKAIDYITDLKTSGVNIAVMSNSWAGGGFSTALNNAIARANAAGIVFVAAAGNSNSDNDAAPTFPANYEQPNVVAVGATTYLGQRAGFSNYGVNTVDIGAPGESILSTVPGNQWSYFSGTSMATPHVAGVIALIKAANPSINSDDLIAALFAGATTNSNLSSFFHSGRFLNAYGAIDASFHLTPTPTGTPTATESATMTPSATPTTTPVPSSTPTPTLAPEEPQPTPTLAPDPEPEPTIEPDPIEPDPLDPDPEDTPDPGDEEDLDAPLVEALKSTGQFRKSITLKYIVDEYSGETREQIKVKKKSKIVKTINRPLSTIPESGLKQYKFLTKGLTRGSYSFCVTSTDLSGNTSEQSCAALKIR